LLSAITESASFRTKTTAQQTTTSTKRTKTTTKRTKTTTKPTTTTTKRLKPKTKICRPGFVGDNCEIECGVTFFEQNLGEDYFDLGIVGGEETIPHRFFFDFY
jgi:hypothetical protein